MPFSNIEEDFADLFAFKKHFHLNKYVHMHRPEIFEELVKCKSYYPFRLECKIIKDWSQDIAADLMHVTHFIEMGPGSETPVLNKSVPLIDALRKGNLKEYCAVDINVEYAKNACDLVKTKHNDLQTRSSHLDFYVKKQLLELKDHFKQNDSKLIACFGGTVFSAGDDKDSALLIENFVNLLDRNEHLILSADISDVEESLTMAYNTDLAYQLMLNAMFGIKNHVNDENFDPTAFELIFQWNKQTTTAETFLKATKAQSITIKGAQYSIDNGAIYSMLNSRKTSIRKIESLLDTCSVKIVDIFQTIDDFGNKFALLKAQKI